MSGLTNDQTAIREKLYRDARVFQIYDGTNEVQKILISRELEAGYSRRPIDISSAT